MLFITEVVLTWDTIYPELRMNGWSTFTKEMKVHKLIHRWLRTKEAKFKGVNKSLDFSDNITESTNNIEAGDGNVTVTNNTGGIEVNIEERGEVTEVRKEADVGVINTVDLDLSQVDFEKLSSMTDEEFMEQIKTTVKE